MIDECDHEWEFSYYTYDGFEIHKCTKCGEETIPEAM